MERKLRKIKDLKGKLKKMKAGRCCEIIFPEKKLTENENFY